MASKWEEEPVGFAEGSFHVTQCFAPLELEDLLQGWHSMSLLMELGILLSSKRLLSGSGGLDFIYTPLLRAGRADVLAR